MKTVTIEEAEQTLATLLAELKQGDEVTITRDGVPVATLAAVPQRVVRKPGSLRDLPAWRDFVYDPAIFAPMTDEQMRDEGWPV